MVVVRSTPDLVGWGGAFTPSLEKNSLSHIRVMVKAVTLTQCLWGGGPDLRWTSLVSRHQGSLPPMVVQCKAYRTLASWRGEGSQSPCLSWELQGWHRSITDVQSQPRVNLRRAQCRDMEHLRPLKGSQTDVPISLIHGICVLWTKVQSCVECYHPDKVVADCNINIFSDSAMSHFRYILKMLILRCVPCYQWLVGDKNFASESPKKRQSVGMTSIPVTFLYLDRYYCLIWLSYCNTK